MRKRKEDHLRREGINFGFFSAEVILLKRRIFKELTRVRQSRKPDFEKAIEFANFLRMIGAKNVQIVTCDVCENDLHPGREELFLKLVEKYKKGREINWAKLTRELNQLTPKEAFVRVHAETPLGYLTYCFHCDSTMCRNQVRYPEEPNWDEIHRKTAAKFLKQLAKEKKIKIIAFMLSGSTRKKICIDVIVRENSSDFIDYLEVNFESYKIYANFLKDFEIFEISKKIGAKVNFRNLFCSFPLTPSFFEPINKYL
jgi:hypothetical protein